METRGRYHTRQRELVGLCLSLHPDSYLSVDEVWKLLSADGHQVGRTTVYRNLETLASEGTALKVRGAQGEMRYRQAPVSATGQLVCLSCNRVLPLDCNMLTDFSLHVQHDHGFLIDQRRTVIYGLCARCAGYAHGC